MLLNQPMIPWLRSPVICAVCAKLGTAMSRQRTVARRDLAEDIVQLLPHLVYEYLDAGVRLFLAAAGVFYPDFAGNGAFHLDGAPIHLKFQLPKHV